MALLAGITGAFGVYYSSSIGKTGHEVGAELAPLGDAAMEIKLTATTAHLIFEEIMGGDASEDVAVVWELLGETVWYCDAILKGGENDEGHFVASRDPAVLSKMEAVKASVLAFTASAKERHAGLGKEGVDQAEADARFDEGFERFIAQADEAESLIHDDMDRGCLLYTSDAADECVNV